MDYECQTVPLDRTLVTSSGPVKPLCTDCRAVDCSNPIKEQTVSVRGINVKMRLWVVGNVVRQVTACKGYIGDQHVFVPNV